MTLPTIIRLFFALDLPEVNKKTLGILINSLKKMAHTHSIRWSRPENLHVTLQFLAKVRSADVQGLIEKVRVRLAGKVAGLELIIHSLKLFPNPYRPRVIVLETGPQKALAELASLIGEGIRASNYEIETRPFKAHLTLGRIKQPQTVHFNFLTQAILPEMDTMPINEVILYRSEPQPEGSHYIVMERIKL